MGSSSSKFRKHLQNGDEYAALQLFNNSSDLRKGLDPNSSYGDTYNHDAPMHYATRHAMKSLLRIFLYELGGNPNKRNSRNETSLHCVCMTVTGQSYALQQRRFECLTLLLQWRGAKLKDGEVERVDLGAQDEKNNTALHYAAASGLKRCVELLVSQNAPLFTENGQRQTPCDCAEKCGHNEIALYLESKMVFSKNEDEDTEETDVMLDQMEAEDAYSGLRAQDLQEAKDQLLVETSDMLRVPLFTAEALLRNHEWSREMLLEAWMEDSIACCEKCGVVPPACLFQDKPPPPEVDHELKTPTHTVPPPTVAAEIICDICACLISTSEESVPMACEDQFCRSCWERYLTGKIQEGDAHNITCPGFQCHKLVPVDIIETLVSRDMARRYLQFDIKAFVDSNPNIKWCPYPGCGRAVRLPDSDNPMSPTFRDPMGMNQGNDFSHAVDCGNGHVFCWECLGEAHEPASCDHWQQWHQKIGEVKPEEMSGTEEETEMAANCLWLVTNSKPCPNCKSPIQKNEGCNHMKCSKCKHDFCWVCLEAWKKHSSATGGYFRCNRYEVVRKVEEGTDSLKSDAEARNKRMQELNKFVHYYTRFKNHENSYKLEEPLVSTAKEKMMVLAKAVTDPDTANMETKFVEDAVHQLLKARRVLKCSYVYGYYLEETGYKKPIFEFMQTELEECTETLSEMIARPYLRTPRHKIIQTAHLVQRKRHEFVTAIAKGLVPADTSPNMRKKRKKYSVELDEDLKKALLASIQDLNPSTAWVKDPTGRHTNLAAVLDWPDESDESDSEQNPAIQNKEGVPGVDWQGEGSDDSEGEISSILSDAAQTPQGPKSGVATCIRKGCTRPRAQNPRTGEIHDHCSIKCMRSDQIERQEGEETFAPEDYFNDYEMELLRALEMSRLQFLREMGNLKPGCGDKSPNPSASPIPGTSSSVSLDISPPAPLVLQDPPRGKLERVSPNPDVGTPPLASTQSAVSELERALELSKITCQGPAQAEERDLKLAIEMSLSDTASPDLTNQESSASGRQQATEGHNPYSDQYTSVVTRVPNRSVEDLVRETGGDRPNPEILGACGGIYDGNQAKHCRPHEREGSGVASYVGATDATRGKQNSFGIIKDLSVNNIVSSDLDKTKEFEKKDFSHIFVKCHAPDVKEMESKVFEPRPPYPGSKDDSCGVKKRPPHNSAHGSGHNRRPETWADYPVSSGSEGQDFRSGSYLRSRSSAPPSVSRSPRSPRDPLHRSAFPFDQHCNSSLGLPDSLSRSPRETHIDENFFKSVDSYRPPYPSYTSRYDFEDDDDPGPQLDAVLRSLSKLTSRLGDDDDDEIFLGPSICGDFHMQEGGEDHHLNTHTDSSVHSNNQNETPEPPGGDNQAEASHSAMVDSVHVEVEEESEEHAVYV